MISNEKKGKSFERALAEIEKIIDEIDGGEMPLDQVVAKFKLCSSMITSCRSQLEQVEQQIEILGDDLEGKTGDRERS